MSEVIRYLASHTPYEGLDLNGECARHDGDYFVSAVDFDRVTAERDALQQRLTAADERADVLEGLLREVQKSARKQGWSSGYPTLFASVDAALKPAEEPRNQCDGCQAGIPVVNGAHRMGKPDGYPDTMSCTANLYKPASGSTCNQILEESGLPTNYPCKSCGRGACIDR